MVKYLLRVKFGSNSVRVCWVHLAALDSLTYSSQGGGGILCLPQRPCLLSFWGRSAVPDGILSHGNKIQSGFNAKQVYSLMKQVSLYGEVVV